MKRNDGEVVVFGNISVWAFAGLEEKYGSVRTLYLQPIWFGAFRERLTYFAAPLADTA